MPNQERVVSHSRASPSCWAHSQASVGASASNSRYLELSGLRVRYVGPGIDDKDAASVRADRSVPFGCGLYYFEVQIVNKGRNGLFGIGFSAPSVNLDRLPGWEPHSYGYHGDDGHAFHHSGKGVPYGPTFSTGDVIGVIYNRNDKMISYSKNGMHLGIAFFDVKEEVLYPTVGMKTPDEEILANFGATPFQADLSSIRADAALKVEREISNIKLPKTKGPRVLEQLIFDYLRQQGYGFTAARAREDLLCNSNLFSECDLQDIQLRRQIIEAIMAGNIDAAIALVNQAAPGLLEKQHTLNFRLLCQKFMWMICNKQLDAALEFGHTRLGPMVQSSLDRERLQDSLTLVAHDNPMDCPCYQQLLSKAAHAKLAASVNAALLGHQGRSERSSLESIMRHLEVIKCELLNRGDAATDLINYPKYSRSQKKGQPSAS